MNKEEMLQSLKDLKFNINGGLVDNETKEKLENLEIDLNLLDDEIFELSNKIQDDTNYPTFFIGIYEIHREDSFNKRACVHFRMYKLNAYYDY